MSIDTSGQDSANYMARYYNSNALIHVVITYECETVQLPELHRAVGSLLINESILAHRFVVHDVKPYWEKKKSLIITDLIKYQNISISGGVETEKSRHSEYCSLSAV